MESKLLKEDLGISDKVVSTYGNDFSTELKLTEELQEPRFIRPKLGRSDNVLLEKVLFNFRTRFTFFYRERRLIAFLDSAACRTYTS